MQNTKHTSFSRLARVAAAGAATVAAIYTTGCAANFRASNDAPVPIAGVKLQGKAYGGQQPVVGTNIQLYAAATTGYGVASYALLNTPVVTDAGGNFGITGDYTCPSSTSQVYIVATGGAAGSYSTNTSIAMMAPLGSCGNLNANTFITINELTTVAGAYALAQFMSGPAQLSSSLTNTTGLNIAFASVNKLVNTGVGQMPGTSLPPGATEPVAELNTLANILAACINSSTGSNGCTTLFANATPPGGSAPTDTITAILNVAKNPSLNVANLFNLAPSTSPFQPSLPSAPTDFTVSVKYSPTITPFSAPSAAALDASGNLWVTNAGNNTISMLNATSSQATIFAGGGLSGPSGIAFDAAGNAWVTDKTSSKLSVFTASGVGSQTSASTLNTPTGVAVDGQGIVWVSNAGNNSITANAVSGTTISASTSYSTGAVNAPVALAINPR